MINWLNTLCGGKNVDDGYGVDPMNPVKCGGGPAGERDYLNRLRCPGGDSVEFVRRMSTSGASDMLVDLYEVTCGCGKHNVNVYLDMYNKKRNRPIGIAGWRLV